MINISYRGVRSKLFLAATGPLRPLVAPQMLLPSTSWVGRRRWSSEEQKSSSSQIMLAPKESFDLVSDLRWMVDGCLPPLKKWLLLLSASSILSGRAGRPCKRSRKLQKQFLNETTRTQVLELGPRDWILLSPVYILVKIVGQLQFTGASSESTW